ncbi:MAG: EAL domain-containing protein [Desulfovibrio sp.]|nr:MAG: EAL domain-containing protein [Desulfovibrio sp.]
MTTKAVHNRPPGLSPNISFGTLSQFPPSTDRSMLGSANQGLGQAGDILAAHRSVNMLFLELENFFAFQSLFGDHLAGQILAAAELQLYNAAKDFFSDNCLHLERLQNGQFLMLCKQIPGAEDLSDQALNLRLRLKNGLRDEALKLTGQSFNVLAGYSVLTMYGDMGHEAALYNALCDAQLRARGHLEGIQPGVLSEFRAILENLLMISVYQPIVDLAKGKVFAWEALTRGPKNSVFHSPAALFDYAEDVGEIFALEKACREKAIHSFGPVEPGQKLFLNIHPRTLIDPAFSPGETMKLLNAHGLKPDNVVFEITERHAIRDFTTFHRTLDHYRNQGYMIAVDDVGTGYSGLWSIAELRPDFIKIDMSFIRGIDANPVKRALLETFITFSEKIGCKIIAEGIETATELSSLISMNTHYGQGFYLAKPEYPKPGLALNLPAWSAAAPRVAEETRCSIPIRSLAEPAYPIEPNTIVRDAKMVLAGDEPISALVVARREKPLGLVMSHHLDRALSSQYGMSLYYNREVTRIMDGSPLIVEADTLVEAVARRATSRERAKIYDHIIITDKGSLLGIVSVQRMLDTLASVQVEMAKGVSPLTGLPGNLAIEQEIEARTLEAEPFSIIYADLDNFKVYNDVYGFKNGDNIILLLAKILTWALKRHGSPEDFCGHVGGDDLVAVTQPETAERIALAVIRCFGRLVKYHYSPDDQAAGEINGKDRYGVERAFSLVTVSLAIVDCKGRINLAAIAKRSAEMKKYAKSVDGNSFVRDRRGFLSEEGDAELSEPVCSPLRGEPQEP